LSRINARTQPMTRVVMSDPLRNESWQLLTGRTRQTPPTYQLRIADRRNPSNLFNLKEFGTR
jgi:hypothetical protein